MTTRRARRSRRRTTNKQEDALEKVVEKKEMQRDMREIEGVWAWQQLVLHCGS